MLKYHIYTQMKYEEYYAEIDQKPYKILRKLKGHETRTIARFQRPALRNECVFTNTSRLWKVNMMTVVFPFQPIKKQLLFPLPLLSANQKTVSLPITFVISQSENSFPFPLPLLSAYQKTASLPITFVISQSDACFPSHYFCYQPIRKQFPFPLPLLSANQKTVSLPITFVISQSEKQFPFPLLLLSANQKTASLPITFVVRPIRRLCDLPIVAHHTAAVGSQIISQTDIQKA